MTFFKKLKKLNKRAFVCVSIFFGLSLILMLLNLQISPIFVWGMYSTSVKEIPKSYSVYTLEYNNQIFDLPVWQDYRRMFYNYTIPEFDVLREHKGIDPFYAKLESHHVLQVIINSIINQPKTLTEYPKWLERYISAVTGEKINHLSVTKYQVSYLPDGKLHTDSTKIIILKN